MIHWCHIKNQSTSPRCHLIKSEIDWNSLLQAPLGLISCLSVVWVWIGACLKVVLWIWPSSFSEYIWVCVFKEGLCSLLYWTAQKLFDGVRNGTLYRNLEQSFKGLSHWLQLRPTDPDSKYYYKHYCLSSNIHSMQSTFMGIFIRLLPPYSWCSQQMIIVMRMHYSWIRGMKKYLVKITAMHWFRL